MAADALAPYVAKVISHNSIDYMIDGHLFSTRKDFNYLCHLGVEK